MLIIDGIFDNFDLPKISKKKSSSSRVTESSAKIQIIDPLSLQAIKGNPPMKTAGKFKKMNQIQTEADKARLQKLWLKQQMQLLKKLQHNDNLKLEKKKLNALKKIIL